MSEEKVKIAYATRPIEVIDELGNKTTIYKKIHPITTGNAVVVKDKEGNFKTLNKALENIETTEVDNETTTLVEGKVTTIGHVTTNELLENYWTGTKAEYDLALVAGIITPNTICNVLDDISDLVLDIPTATTEDIGLCMPDTESITIDDTGKLSVKNDYVIETGSNNYGHYRKWNSGYLEQWGVFNSFAQFTESSLFLPVAFKDTSYSIVASIRGKMNGFIYIYPQSNTIAAFRVANPNGTPVDAQLSYMARGYWK